MTERLLCPLVGVAVNPLLCPEKGEFFTANLEGEISGKEKIPSLRRNFFTLGKKGRKKEKEQEEETFSSFLISIPEEGRERNTRAWHGLYIASQDRR